MNNILKSLIIGFMSIILLVPCAMASPPFLADLIYESNRPGTSVSLQEVDGEYILFLPSSAQLTNLTFKFDGDPVVMTVAGKSIVITGGQPFDLTALYHQTPSDGIYSFTLSRDNQELSVKLMVAKGIGSLHITSAYPINNGRSWVESNKSNKASGQAVLIGADGAVVYDGELKQIKGRGNSTWLAPKKPYQIKIADKADLLDTGDPKEAEKTWVLLANYFDEALIRNSLTYDLAAEVGLAYSPNSRPVNLYYDGEYRGIYLISEKTEVGSGRVDIHDLEKDYENANPQINDFDDLSTASGYNTYGNEYKYVTGLNDPVDITGGYLLEMDYLSNAASEKNYFTTTHGYNIVSKSPEYISRNAMEYISELYQEFEDAVFNGGINPATGKSYKDYADLESLAKCHLILELSQDGDAYQTSTFFYKPAGEEKFYFGPVWDFDSSYGTYSEEFITSDIIAGTTPLGRALLSIPSFCQALEEIYKNEMHRLITDVVISPNTDARHGRLRSVAGYGAEVAGSVRMDSLLWKSDAKDYNAELDIVQSFITERSRFLYDLKWPETSSSLPRFIDVRLNEWYYPYVDFVVDKGLFSGVSINLFDPYGTINRAMAATVLYRLAGEPDVHNGVFYADADQYQWFSNAALWTAEAGLFQAEGDGLFHPNENVTRQEFAAMLYRHARNSGYDVSSSDVSDRFSDWDSVAYWAADAVSWAVDKGIMNGTDTGELLPDDCVTRCTAAAMIERYDSIIAADLITME